MALQAINNTQLNILDNQADNKQRALVWAHGLMFCTAADIESGLFAWKQTSQQHRVIRYDARGHGESEATADIADYQWPSLAQDMLAVAATSGAEKLVLGGASMGCGTSLMAALDLINSGQQDKLGGLVLVIPPTAWQTRAAQTGKYKLLAMLNKLKLVPALIPLLTKNKVIAGFLNKSSSGVEAILQRHMASHKKQAYFPILMGSARSDLPAKEELKKIKVPTLILGWTEDSSHPVSTAQQLHQLLPHSKLHLAASAGDVEQWDGQISEFLSGLDS